MPENVVKTARPNPLWRYRQGRFTPATAQPGLAISGQQNKRANAIAPKASFEQQPMGNLLPCRRRKFLKKGVREMGKTLGITLSRRTAGRLASFSALAVLTLGHSSAAPAEPGDTRTSRDRAKVREKGGNVLDARIVVSTQTGVFVVFEAPREGEAAPIAPPFLAYWRFRGADGVLVFDRSLHLLTELGEAILTLRGDLQVDPSEIAIGDARLARALALAGAVEGKPDGEWIPATRRNVMVIAGQWSPHDFDPAAAAEITSIVAPPCLLCYAGAAAAEDDKSRAGNNPPGTNDGGDAFEAAVAARLANAATSPAVRRAATTATPAHATGVRLTAPSPPVVTECGTATTGTPAPKTPAIRRQGVFMF